ncbi:MAG: MFS transporter [Pseudomonadota bacterium]|nr:MFS transporter [Pseudomonadota bacterium]
MTSHQDEENAPSAWAPFANTGFALLWSATLISNVGTWMHDVGAGWLMTTLAPSPAIVSLVQAANTFPIFLFALLAGALADRVDRRRLLLTINVVLLGVVAMLALLVHLQRMTPGLLLLFTLAIGTGTAFMAPAWQSVVPTLVPRAQLKSAIALNSLSVNISRAIGPALAGVLLGSGILAAPFAVNALSFVAIIAALLLWRPAPSRGNGLPPEAIVSAMVTGLRHVSFNQPLRHTMTRTGAFCFFAAAYWALLPVVARAVPGADAGFYGILLGAVGTGAVAGALILPKLRKKIAADWLVLHGTLGTVPALLVYAFVDDRTALVAASTLAGFGWITVLTCLNVSAQTALPDWVRARGLAVYMMVLFGSLSLGSALWGQVAALSSNGSALASAAVLLVVMVPLTWHAKLGRGEHMDLSPSSWWPTPIVSDTLGDLADRGPVLVTVAYTVMPYEQAEFLREIRKLSTERYRDGAYVWGIYQDLEHPDDWLEWFQLPSWNEHLRQHQRATVHGRDVQERVRKFHRGSGEPIVRHLAAPASRTGGDL